jgi:hypothetical protein
MNDNHAKEIHVVIKASVFINVNKKGAPSDAPLVMNSNPKLFSRYVIGHAVESLGLLASGKNAWIELCSVEEEHHVVQVELHVPNAVTDSCGIAASDLVDDFVEKVVH